MNYTEPFTVEIPNPFSEDILLKSGTLFRCYDSDGLIEWAGFYKNDIVLLLEHTFDWFEEINYYKLYIRNGIVELCFHLNDGYQFYNLFTEIV